MTPQQKIAAGRGVVGYLRVSSEGQTDGFSLELQQTVIERWAQDHGIPIIAIEKAPAGFESGAVAFDDRAGWQAVERHIATNRVGWIAVSAIDRLSRDLGQLADRVRDWSNRDIAIVAPGQGYRDPDGIGSFLLHLFAMLAEHERGRLLGRVLPGMHARLLAGLPLGRQPLGYRVASETPANGRQSHRRLVPDLDTGPWITALFTHAAEHPDLGDRRMAEWAEATWPTLTWSVGRVAGILKNEIYAGVLRGQLQGETVLILDNHPPLVDPVLFATVQAQRKQRAQDHADGIRSAAVTSWLGGLAICGCCGGTVTWRSGGNQSDVRAGPTSGHYTCTSNAPPRVYGCGTAWPSDIETFVHRALCWHLEADVERIRKIVTTAHQVLPEFIDDQRAHAAQVLQASQEEQAKATGELEVGHLQPESYENVIRNLAERETRARDLLQVMDGWEYLARLIALQEGPEASRWRWVPVGDAILALPRDEQRRLLRATFTTITLQDPATIGSLDGPGEDPTQGRFTGATVVPNADDQPLVTGLAKGLARILVRTPGLSVAEGLKTAGWTSRKDGSWQHPDGGQLDVIRSSEDLARAMPGPEDQSHLLLAAGWIETAPGKFRYADLEITV
ncbi:hypothetical protein LBMAG53_25730 [Planctomycetota bacterium]|nr:hypothetical protein LBMAG53_25730 [Planctomycetota bacterium]